MKIMANEPLENIMIDIAGRPLTKTKTGNQFILSIIDVFSRFIKLIALKQISSHLIMQGIIKKWVVPFCGYPDCGPSLTRKVWTNFVYNITSVSNFLTHIIRVGWPKNPWAGFSFPGFSGFIIIKLLFLCKKFQFHFLQALLQFSVFEKQFMQCKM